MSTQKIREALAMLEAVTQRGLVRDAAKAAVAEVEAIERASAVVDRLGLQSEPRDLLDAPAFNERVAARRTAIYLFVDIAKEARIRKYEAAQRSGGTAGAKDAGASGAQE